MKKLLILGGSDLQVSLIRMAKKMGHYVITCDFLPHNPGHLYSDEYHNVSTTDKEGVLQLAKEKKVDGILAYASDPAAPTAAWVCETLGLPTNPFEAVEILTRKDLFRKFQRQNNFIIPVAKSFENYTEALLFFNSLENKAVIKPVDASGSKGIYLLSKGVDFEDKFHLALGYSKVKKIIIEEFIEKEGFQIGGDGLIIDGELIFRCFGDIHFSETNPFLPCAVSIPSLHSDFILKKVHNEIQRLLTLLNMKMGGLNFDIVVNRNNEIIILEIGARNGGNMLPELIHYCTGIDMKDFCIKLALNLVTPKINGWEEKKYFSHYVVHSKVTGELQSITKAEKLEKIILYQNFTAKPGDIVRKFANSSDRLGIFLIEYSNKQEMLDVIYNMEDYLKIVVNNG